MTSLTGSLIAAIALLTVAVFTFITTRRMQLDSTWRTLKLEYYQEFMDALAQNVEGDANEISHREFARASNNLLLIAPSAVLKRHHAYREQISFSNKSRDYSLDAHLLASLIFAMRADLKMPQEESIDPNLIQLWRSTPA